MLTGQVDDVLPDPEVRRSRDGRSGGAGRLPRVQAIAMLNSMYLPMSVSSVVDDGDQQHGPLPQSRSGVQLVAGQQRGGLRRVDRERRHQRGRALGVDGQHERDAVDERVAPGLPLRASGISTGCSLLDSSSQHQREHVAARVLADEDVEVRVVRERHAASGCPGACRSKKLNVRCWLSGRKHRFRAPAKNDEARVGLRRLGGEVARAARCGRPTETRCPCRDAAGHLLEERQRHGRELAA